MVMKLFVLGRAGSGKSTFVRYFTEAAQKDGWYVKSFDDHDILRDMFLREVSHDKYRLFRPTAGGGFEVRDFQVYDRVLESLEREISHFEAPQEKTVVTIEFVRNNYQQAIRVFTKEFLRDASYLFLASDLNTCLKRVQERAAHPCTPDDFYVDENVILSHFPNPSTQIMNTCVKPIFNLGSKEELQKEVERFTRRFLQAELHHVCEKAPQAKIEKIPV